MHSSRPAADLDYRIKKSRNHRQRARGDFTWCRRWPLPQRTSPWCNASPPIISLPSRDALGRLYEELDAERWVYSFTRQRQYSASNLDVRSRQALAQCDTPLFLLSRCASQSTLINPDHMRPLHAELTLPLDQRLCGSYPIQVCPRDHAGKASVETDHI